MRNHEPRHSRERSPQRSGVPVRYGILSDIHSNLEALETALDAVKEVDILVSPGDVVGYGPNPNECCDLIREKNAVIVLGNHDAAVVGSMSLDWFNPFARDAAEWTQRRLTPANRAFLEGLPLIHRSEHFVMVHAALSLPEQFDYITSAWEAGPTFAEMQAETLCLIGHTHLAEFYTQRIGELGSDQISMAAGGSIELRPEFRYVVNCGSVGQPRDYNPNLSIGIYDTESRTVEIRRLDYPVGVVQEKMRAEGLPEPLWRRLEFGV